MPELKHNLIIEATDGPSAVLSVCSPLAPFELAYNMEKYLGVIFYRFHDFRFFDSGLKQDIFFSYHIASDVENGLTYFLFKNKTTSLQYSSNQYLLDFEYNIFTPEVNYVLVIFGRDALVKADILGDWIIKQGHGSYANTDFVINNEDEFYEKSGNTGILDIKIKSLSHTASEKKQSKKKASKKVNPDEAFLDIINSIDINVRQNSNFEYR